MSSKYCAVALDTVRGDCADTIDDAERVSKHAHSRSVLMMVWCSEDPLLICHFLFYFARAERARTIVRHRAREANKIKIKARYVVLCVLGGNRGKLVVYFRQ